MANISPITQANAFYKARLEASTHNEVLSSREGAADIMAIDRGRLYRIENGITNPYPEEVHMMADLYNAPHLRNNYCRSCCPLGCNVPEIYDCNLDRISLRALSILKEANALRDDLLDITADGEIEESEKSKMNEIIKALRSYGEIAANLHNWLLTN